MQLNFPTYNFKVKKVENRNYIFDIIRKKFVVLTPEEWVRQHLVHYLIEVCKCPTSLIAVEKGLVINGLQKRFDVLVYNNLGLPILLAECKAPDIALSTQTFLQAAVYNQALQVQNLVITNGLQLQFCQYQPNFKAHKITTDIPAYPFT